MAMSSKINPEELDRKTFKLLDSHNKNMKKLQLGLIPILIVNIILGSLLGYLVDKFGK